jgi:hydroxymethylglutaryl-CoA lyase
MSAELAPEVLIEDEFLRDGLQHESTAFTVDEKVQIARALGDCGVRRIQVGSFVHPQRVPQMADTDQVFAALGERPGVVYTALVLNMKGVERAIAAKARHLSMSVSASPTHSLKNLNQTIDGALVGIREMISRARNAGIDIRAGIQCAFGSPFESEIAPESVADIARQYRETGVQEINLADTAGMANPRSVRDVVSRVRDAVGETVCLSLHLHDTRGLGIANAVAGLEAGVRTFDAALGGVGGCPFIPGATGNIATEDAAYALEQMGVTTGIGWQRLSALSAQIEQRLGRRLPSHMAHLKMEAAA